MMKKSYIFYVFLLGVFSLLLARPHSTVNSSMLGFTNTPLPTNAPTETNTPLPTNTPVQTSTPIPTLVPTNTPTATARPAHSDPTQTIILPAAGDGSQQVTKQNSVIGELDIPALGLDLPIVMVPQDGYEWDLTNLDMNAGWLEHTAGLNQAGNKVIIGHLDLVKNKQGPFFNLDQLKVGDQVIVTYDGIKVVYQAIRIFKVDDDDAQFVDSNYPADLTLITCLKGSWDKKAHNYHKRLVVTFYLVGVGK